MRAVLICAALVATCGCTKDYWEGFGDRAARAASIINAGTPGLAPAQPMQPMRPARFYVRSFVSGMNRICVYNSMGSEVYVTIGAAEICPIN